MTMNCLLWDSTLVSLFCRNENGRKKMFAPLLLYFKPSQENVKTLLPYVTFQSPLC